ncbi:MAG TPA: hypothetical protein VGP41_02395 [Candidatus Lustribacter sp.]|jgi:hypothetical protein|nr:hypothetical protein [Candidatus Lustribacter sp.]
MMRNTSRTAALAAALLLAGAPALASADDVTDAAAVDTVTAPIQVNNVQFTAENTADGSYGPAAAEIAYTNASSQPATEVVFAVTTPDGNMVDMYDDVGTFSPGVTIDHTFPALEAADASQVSVAQVTFADGSVWLNPGLASAPAATDDSGS